MKKRQILWAGIFILFFGNAIPEIFTPPPAVAAVPNVILYEGRLLDAQGVPVTTAHDFRFSFWASADFSSTDLQNDGSIDTASSSYSNWQEVQTVTPGADGAFSIPLGQQTSFPELDFSRQKFLQVEIKDAGGADTSYQLMDPTGDNGADANDRATIGSLPYAFNAQNAEQSAAETFILDTDDTVATAATGAVKLQFGNTLGKYLSYDLDQHYFHFNDSVDISGDLTVSGLINGVNITSLPGGHAQNTDTGTTASSFVINSVGVSLTLQTTGLTAPRTITFPDASTTLVGTDTAQTLTQKSIDGTQNTLTNIDVSALAPYQKTLLLTPAYPQMNIGEDGTDNLITLKQGFDEGAHQHYYVVSSEENTLQDIDLQIPVQIPSDFVSWSDTPIQIFFKTLTPTASENHLDISLQDTAQSSVILTGASNLVSSPDTWEEAALTFSGSPTFTPGQTILLDLKLQSTALGKVTVGTINLAYLGR